MKDKEKNFISAVIYVHNSERWIGEFLENIIRILECNFEQSEIICVNDGTKDDSVCVIREISKKAVSTNISILNMSAYHGLEAAMGAGVDLAIGDFVLEFDNVVQDFDNEVVMELYNKALQGYDIVSASPDCVQTVRSKIFYAILNKAAYAAYEIRSEKFRILSRRVINRVGSMNKSVPYRKMVYANCGLPGFHIRYSRKIFYKGGVRIVQKRSIGEILLLIR